jgi:hypothetical protein
MPLVLPVMRERERERETLREFLALFRRQREVRKRV